MQFDKKLAGDFLAAITFERLGGTPAENKAVQLIRAAVQRAGAVARVECFSIRTFTKGTAALEILAPYQKQYSAKPVAMTGHFPIGGKKLPLLYVGMKNLATMRAMRGKAIYGYGLVCNEQLALIKKHDVAAILNIADFGRALRYGCFGAPQRKQFGRTPIITIPYEAGLEMAQRHASLGQISLNQGERQALSKNVIVTVKGSCPAINEEIVICAHHDSVPDSPGANDNGGGCAIMIALLKHFVKNPTRRALRFIWFGSEEQGLLGSQAYVKAHARELARVKMVINIDGAGRVLAPNYAIVTGPDGLKTFVETIGKRRGMKYPVTEGVLSSDGIPFSLHKIPSINITGGSDHNLFVHTANDQLKWCGADGLAPSGAIALAIIRQLGNARSFPYERGFNKTVCGALQNYYKNVLLLKDNAMPAWRTGKDEK